MLRIVLISAVFCLTSAALLTAQQQDETAIRELQQHQAEAWNRHDATAYANLFLLDGDVVNVVGWWWQGRPFPRRRLSIERLPYHKQRDGLFQTAQPVRF